MTTDAWVDGIRGINNGEAVNAAVTNRPLDDLNQKANYLKAQLDALHNGEALYLRNRSVAPECFDGCAVYYDAANSRFGPALASVGFSDGVNVIHPSSFAVGIVAKKLSSTIADIIIGGSWPYADFSAVSERLVSGPRYLSASQPGMLVDVMPAFAVRVGQWLAESNTLLVQPVPRDVVESHVHYRFKLHSEPAGVEAGNVYMNKHSFASANPALPGWLPADHASFQGSAPAGAKFGYNLAAHPSLFKVFPPVPLDGAYVEAYIDGAGAGREMDKLVLVDQSGIWWMSDDWGWAPWAVDIATLDESSGSVTDPTQTPPPIELQHGHGYVGTNPTQQYRFALYLWFSKPIFDNANASVLSIRPETGSPITITDCDGEPATTGHLRVGLDLNLVDDGKDYPGDVVVKELDAKSMKRGTVVSRLKSANSHIVLTNADNKAPDDQGFYGGRVMIEYKDPATQKKEFDTALFALNGATQEDQFDLFYIGLKSGTSNSVRGRVDIPAVGVSDGKFEVQLKVRFFVDTAGSLPNLRLTYRRVPASATPAVLPNNAAEVALTDIVLSDASGGAPVRYANMYFDASSAKIEVYPGDTLFFTIQRGGDSYAGMVGVMRVKAVIA